jgi:hypothetical protein
MIGFIEDPDRIGADCDKQYGDKTVKDTCPMSGN